MESAIEAIAVGATAGGRNFDGAIVYGAIAERAFSSK